MPEERKLVTVLFADIVGSTSMTASADAEVVRARLTQLFARTRRILVEHGATVEKFIGDEVMAVFGVPLAHEDDPERAIRSASALRAEFSSTGSGPIGALELRIGVNSGEVVAGSADAGEFLVTGQAVNYAARLEKACGPGEILVGPLTRSLTISVARYGEARKIAAKGLGTIEGWPLEALPSGAHQRPSTPFVGREREMALLAAFWEHAIVSGRPYLVTLLGEAGIGKTRLAEETLGRAQPAHIARARCAPYGEGIGLRPIDDLVGVDDDGLDASVRFRKHVESLARSGPVAVVLEDIHWADPGLLAAIEELVDRARGPILVLCLARDDLLRVHPTWGGGRANAASVALGPLSDLAVEDLVARLAPGALPEGSARFVIGHAEGNPLFVHEYVRTFREAGGVVASIPPTLHALLAARLDHLPPDERELMRRASIVGRVFGRDALTVLGLDGPALDRALEDAVAREMLAHGDRERDHAHWSFVHALVREVAYASLPKADRLRYHDRLSRWLETAGADLGLAAYHAEHAFENAAALSADEAPALAIRAFELLRRAGQRSSTDAHEALALYEHALRIAEMAGASADAIFEVRASAVMARLRLHGSAEAVAEMDTLLSTSDGRVASETLVHLLVWKASLAVLDDPREARAILARAADAAARLDDTRLVLYVRWASSEAAAAAGDRDAERAILRETLAALPAEWSTLHVSCLADLVASALASGERDSAVAYARELEPSIDVVESAASRFRALEATSRAVLADGDRASAARRAEAAASLARDLASPWALARAALARSAVMSAGGAPGAAVAILREALANEELARRPTMRGVVTELRCELAIALAGTGDASAAASEAEAARRAAPLADARVRAHLERAERAARQLTGR